MKSIKRTKNANENSKSAGKKSAASPKRTRTSSSKSTQPALKTSRSRRTSKGSAPITPPSNNDWQTSKDPVEPLDEIIDLDETQYQVEAS